MSGASGQPGQNGETAMSAEVASKVQALVCRITNGDPIESIVDDILGAFTTVLGLRKISLVVSAPDLHLGEGRSTTVPLIDLEKKLDEKHRIADCAYFSRPHEYLGDKDGKGDWEETDEMLFPLRDIRGNILGCIVVRGSSDGRLPPEPLVKSASTMANLLSVAFARVEQLREGEKTPAKLTMRTDLLEDILRIASSIVSERDLLKLSNMILSSVSTLFDFERVTLVTYDDVAGAFKWMALFGYPNTVVRETRFRTIPVEVVMEDLRESRRIGRAVYFTPVEDITPSQKSHFADSSIFGKDIVPPSRGKDEMIPGDTLAFALHDSTGRVVGVIYPSYPRSGKIPDKEMIETIEIFTSLAEVALENARLSAEREHALRVSAQRTEQLSRILDITSDILYIRDLDQMLGDVLKTLAHLQGIRRMTIGVRNEEKGVFQVQAVYGFSEERAEGIKQVEYPLESVDYITDPRYRSPISPVKWNRKVGRMTYYMPAEGYTLTSEDLVYYPDTELIRMPRKGEGYWHELDYMDTFIKDREGTVIAYLEILKPRDDRVPDSDTIEVIEIFASLAGIGIENARMLEQQIESRKDAEFYTDLLSHDIKNFNQAIMGYLDILKAQLPKPEQTVLVDKIYDQVSNVSRLASNVRTMSRMAWGAGKLIRTDIGAVLLECMRNVPQYYMTRKIEFSHRIQGGVAYTMADELLRELFVNILTNAVKYDLHDPVRIEVALTRNTDGPKPMWVVSIGDCGPGISDDMKQRVFERFSQAPKKSGSGLGLHIVQSLVRRYHGRVWVEDRVPGNQAQGALFKVELPASE